MIANDIADVLAIECRANTFPWREQNFQSCLKAGYTGWVFVNCAGETLGYTIVQIIIGEVHILNLCVKKEAQNQGIGRFIVDHIIGFATDHRSLSIILEVRQSNKRAKQLYRNAGFNEIAMRKNYYRAKKGREDAIIMARELNVLNNTT